MRIVYVFMSLILLLVACGGGEETTDETTGNGAQSASTSAAADSGDGAAGSGDCTSGMACAEGLIDELSAFPVPDSVDEFSAGSPDLGGQAAQSMFFDAPPGEVAAFYETALPEAGFEVSPRESMNPDDYQWDLVSPDGQEGSIWIRGASSHPAQAQVTLEVAG